MRDHLVGVNQGYCKNIFEIERNRAPLTLDVLSQNRNLPGMNIVMAWSSNDLWTFIFRHAQAHFSEYF